MKQVTENQLRELLEKAIREGEEIAYNLSRAITEDDVELQNKRRERFLDKLIDSL